LDLFFLGRFDKIDIGSPDLNNFLIWNQVFEEEVYVGKFLG